MNKKFWTGCVVVFVVIGVFEFIVHRLLLASTYQDESMRQLWRPQAEMKLGLLYIVYVFIAYFFTLILSKGYEGKGPMEGVRYGFYVGMLMAIPMAYATYATMPITYSLALQWFIYGVIEYVLAGVAAALVFGKQAMVTQVPKTT
jgi:hypothetical protein